MKDHLTTYTNPITGQVWNTVLVKCQTCGLYYQPRTEREQLARECPPPLHAVDKLRRMGVWRD
jgi:hypothetical protein